MDVRRQTLLLNKQADLAKVELDAAMREDKRASLSIQNHLISQIMFIFEYNVRSSSILGFVGAGGIGFYILGYLRLLEYDKVFLLSFLILITVLIIDYISVRIRDRYLVK